MASTPIEKLDFEDYKKALKTFLQSQERFKDYDFEGSNMAVMLDILAYNTFQNSFYTNMVFSEMFIDSATTRSAMLSHAKELNYLPASVRSATSKIDLTLSVSDDPTFITIPRYTRFTAKAGGKTFSFINLDSETIIPQDGKYCVSGLKINQGKLVGEKYLVTGNANQVFEISNENVDNTTLRVRVRETSDPDSISHEYIYKTSILGVNPSDKVFYIEPSRNENRYSIVFGRNKYGNVPVAGSVIEVDYLVTDGEEANGLKTFSNVDKIAGYNVTSITGTKTEGGADREDLDSIRFFAPKAVQIQDRAITSSDYEILLKTRFPFIEAVSVYGGEELSPPQYGKVIVSVDVKNSDGISENSKEKLEKYLKERAPLTIEPKVVSPQFMYVDVSTTVYYDVKNTSLNTSDIRQKVKDEILNYSLANLSDFGKTFRFSKFMKYIDGADENIVSNDTSVSSIIMLNPEVGLKTSYEFSFNNPLKDDHALSDFDTVEKHVAAVKSSVFIYKGANSFIMDNGLGKLQIFQSQDNKFVPVEQSIGSVDYKTGHVAIANLMVDSYEGSGIKMYARHSTNDFAAPKSRILKIDSKDISINVKALDSK